MKTFTKLRELTGRRPAGQLVVNKKLGRIQVMIYKERNGLDAFMDGDRIDRYKTKNEAEKASDAIVKALKK